MERGVTGKRFIENENKRKSDPRKTNRENHKMSMGIDRHLVIHIM